MKKKIIFQFFSWRAHGPDDGRKQQKKMTKIKPDEMHNFIWIKCVILFEHLPKLYCKLHLFHIFFFSRIHFSCRQIALNTVKRINWIYSCENAQHESIQFRLRLCVCTAYVCSGNSFLWISADSQKAKPVF